MNIFKISLSFKVPNEQGILLDFRTKKQDIAYGVLAFNRQFKNKKTIKLLNINKNSLVLLLKINKPGKITAREITYFSKRLHHDRNWQKYSRDNTKLFTASVFNEVTQQFINDFDKMPEVNTDINQEDLSNVTDVKLSDEDAINALKALINLQNIGSKEIIEKRKNLLLKIKNLLIQSI
ncbi:hypothetical protein [Clostridium tyrobutyricum]|uniref:hypothetical protein n=1 Tax=Clostridium tyrobutyricum TaxID=1519 RepID=UPI001C3851E6|nr:hypothetical protein [Clostridium tyrobutyricum]MBV4425278.1 hypothetical protein [Clostridium tyrobutyricum]